MGSHAILSPSAAHRWLNCTAAPRLEATMPDEGSDFAREGSLAHALGAKRLKTYLGRDTSGEDKEIAELEGEYFSGEMNEYVDNYVAIVLDRLTTARLNTPDAVLIIEKRLDLTGYLPDAFGTADALIITDGTMEVIDFKYGKGVEVSAVNNPQMMIYALGALAEYGFDFRIERVKMTIVQPRIGNLSEFELPEATLLAWARETLIPKAAEAYKGNGAQVAGEHCKFCRAKSVCRALAETCLNTVTDFADPRLLTLDELGDKVLPQLATVKAWLSGIEEYALAKALAGESIKGYKVVEGRSVRKVNDPEGLAERLTAQGYAEADVWRPRELRTITDLEKLTGKKHFAELAEGYIEKPAGKPTLVPTSDKRQAFNAAATDFSDIN